MTLELLPIKEDAVPGMLAGRTLTRNTIWNLLGQGAPMVVAIFAIPTLIKGLGIDRFGILSLAWMFIGYFSLFDLGLGRALTKLVAEKIGAGEEKEIPSLAWTSLFLMAALGVVGAAAVYSVSPWLVRHVLKIPYALQAETTQSFRLFAFSVPIVISTAGLRGILEAQQRFDLTNAVRIPMGVFTFLGPVLVLSFSHSLVPIIAILLVGRVVAWAVHLMFCLHAMPSLRKGIAFQRRVIGPLLRFGGWLTVSNVVAPIMLYLDRFLIAGIMSISAVAYYTTPYDVITKLWIVPTACLGVMFPAFSATFIRDADHTARLYRKALVSVSVLIFPVVVIIVLAARKGLGIWVGPEFAAHSFRVAQLLAVGVFINSMGQVSSTLIQAIGRPDLTAKLHLVELPLYLTYLWFLVHAFGIVGAAAAWVVRVSISAVVLKYMAYRVLRSPPTYSTDFTYEAEEGLPA